MAAGILSGPGTEYGPCEGECQHRDCGETRRMAEAECAHCDKPIGYDVRFYRIRELEEANNIYAAQVFAHAACEEAKVEAARS